MWMPIRMPVAPFSTFVSLEYAMDLLNNFEVLHMKLIFIMIYLYIYNLYIFKLKVEIWPLHLKKKGCMFALVTGICWILVLFDFSSRQDRLFLLALLRIPVDDHGLQYLAPIFSFAFVGYLVTLFGFVLNRIWFWLQYNNNNEINNE